MTHYPPAFGPPMWRVIHLDADRLDQMIKWDAEHPTGQPISYAEKRKQIHAFLGNLDAFLPCDGCSLNYLRFCVERPLPPVDAPDEAFFRWSVDLHNHANRTTGKQELSYEEARKLFNEHWNNYARNKELSDAQLARMQDSAQINNLKTELDHLKRFGTKPATTTVVIIVTCTAAAMLALFFIVWVMWRSRSE